MFRWFKDVSIAKKLYVTIGTMALLIGVELLALMFSLNTLSSLRAYVGGEGLWSKAQKNAVFHLYKFGITGNQKEYLLFHSFMAVIMGDGRARQELNLPNPNMAVARQGFLDGRNHPDDIAGMIDLFRRFHSVYYIDRAITVWEMAESTALQLYTISDKLNKEIKANGISGGEIAGILKSIEPINLRLTELEDEFSYTLGEGSRWFEGMVRKVLLITVLTVEITGLFLAISVSRGIRKGISEIISAAELFAQGIYSARAKVLSLDEIGLLAKSFNKMSDELERSVVNLERLQAKFVLLLEAAPDAMVITDRSGTVRLVNAQFERLFECGREALLGRHVAIIIPERFRGTALSDDGSLAHVAGPPGGDEAGELYCQKMGGREFPAEISVSPLETEEGMLVSAAIRDISDRKYILAQRARAEQALRNARDRLRWQVRELADANEELKHQIAEREWAEAALRDSQRVVQQVIEVLPAMIYIYDPMDGHSIYCNHEVEVVLGYTPDQIDPRGQETLRQLVHPDDRDRWPEGEAGLRVLAHGQTVELEYRMRHVDRSWRWLLGRHAAFAMDAEGRVTRVIGAAVDITARKAAEGRIEHLALHDALTGLPNRALLLDRLGHTLERARRAGAGAAIMALDLDGFKDVNDSFGHDAGDRLLRAVAGRIAGLIRGSDTLARVGGDEFALVQGDIAGPEAAATMAGKVLTSLAAPFDLDGQEVHASASLGIALYPGDGQGPSELLRSADLALYRAKQEGRRRYQLFDPAMDAEAQTRRRVERELRRALERGELSLYYQPQLDLRTDRFTAVEALVRWHHPKRGLVLPGEFVPVAEASGLIHQLGAWVLREACGQAQVWREQGLTLAMGVNVSPAQLRHPDGLGVVDEALRVSGLDPTMLELEITEGLLVELSDGTTGDQLAALAQRGVRIAIDDFGTGYSSLAYLKRLPVQRIKVDRSFVRGIGSDPEDEAVVQAIIGLGHALGKKVVAEGVESAAQLAFLRRLHCDAAQGFLLSRPQSVDLLESMLAA